MQRGATAAARQHRRSPFGGSGPSPRGPVGEGRARARAGGRAAVGYTAASGGAGPWGGLSAVLVPVPGAGRTAAAIGCRYAGPVAATPPPPPARPPPRCGVQPVVRELHGGGGSNRCGGAARPSLVAARPRCAGAAAAAPSAPPARWPGPGGRRAARRPRRAAGRPSSGATWC